MKIQVRDKVFEIFISAEKIQQAIKKMAEEINRDMKGQDPLFLVVLNGAFMFSADLYRHICVESEISFVKFSSYQGMKSTENVREIIGLEKELEGRTIVVVEDIIDSGLTMIEVRKQLKAMHPKNIRLATLLFKPDAFRGNYPIDYIGIEIPNDFIVGYGLDYDGYGRNLPDIYKISE